MANNQNGSNNASSSGSNNGSNKGSVIKHSGLNENAVHKPVPGKGGKGGKGK